MRHFTSTQDWTVGELQALLDQAAGLRSDPVRPLLLVGDYGPRRYVAHRRSKLRHSVSNRIDGLDRFRYD